MSGEAAAAAALGSGRPPSPIRKALARLGRLAGPVAVARLGVMAMGLTDTVVVGRHSAAELGFLALAWAATSPVVGSAMALLSGVQIMAARALGQGEPARAGAALRRGLPYGLWVGVAAALVLGLGMPRVLAALGLKGNLAAGAAGPLTILALSMPSFTVSAAASSWLKGLGRTTVPMTLMWLANGLNLAIDLVLVPGGFGLPALGADGAATATLISRTALALATLAYILRLPDARALGVRKKPARSRAEAAEQRRVGYGAAASSFFEMSAFSSMEVIAGWLGPVAVAAWAVSLNVTALIFMIPLGISTGAAVMVSAARGAGDAAGLARAAAVSLAVTAAIGAASGLLVALAAHPIVGVYTSDPATLRLAAGALALSSLFFIPDHLQVVAAQMLRARGDVLVPSITHLASYVVVMLPLAWALALPLHLGIAGIVTAVIVASWLSAGLLLGRFWMLGRRG